MAEICEKCGLPKDLCVCQEITKESQKVNIKVVRRMFGKKVTIVGGLEKSHAKDLGKVLKKKLACGGTVRDTEVELQGDHKNRVKELLLKEGYKEELIDD